MFAAIRPSVSVYEDDAPLMTDTVSADADPVSDYAADADPVSDYAGNRLQSVIDHGCPVNDHGNPVIDH
jgi:hypothetical protein